MSQKPEIGADGQQHSDHAKALRNVAQANVEAAQAHNDAAAQARKQGDQVKAREHADAALAHASEARRMNHEADMHASIGRADKDEHAEAHADIAQQAHDVANEAVAHHAEASAEREREKGKEKPGEREHAEGEHAGGGEHEGGEHGEGGEHEGGEEKEGLASWVKEKLEGAREHVHEGFEKATEAEEQALEGNIYKAGAEAGKQILGTVAEKGAEKLIGGAGHKAVAFAIQHHEDIGKHAKKVGSVAQAAAGKAAHHGKRAAGAISSVASGLKRFVGKYRQKPEPQE